MKTLILSDLHLGSKHCNVQQILDVLENEPYERLILNGDTLHSVNLRKLTAPHWAVLDEFRRIAVAREVILVRGNHDHEDDYNPRSNDASSADERVLGTRHVLPALLGVPMCEEYRLDVAGRPYLVLHGDRFDPALNQSLMLEMAGWCFQYTRKLSKKFAKWLKKKSKRWSSVLHVVRQQSIAYARRRDAEGIIIGHTHFAEDIRIDNIHFVNTGCWTEPPACYATAHGDEIQLQHVRE